MPSLASDLIQVMPRTMTDAVKNEWDPIAQSLDAGAGLEETLLAHPPSHELHTLILNEVARFVGEHERSVLRRVLTGTQTLRIGTLLPHLVPQPGGIPIVTTNYDRLIEYAAEIQEIGCDTMFVGHYLGVADATASHWAFCRGVRLARKSVVPKYANRVALAKPHGSLGWYRFNGRSIRASVDLEFPPLIVSPGASKYRAGYNPPFDQHRQKANDAIDRATRFLILGYGFNDDHLQTHLEPRILDGVPTLLLSKNLSDNARRLIERSPRMTGLCEPTDHDSSKTVCVGTHESIMPFPAIWDLSQFVKEVLEP